MEFKKWFCETAGEDHTVFNSEDPQFCDKLGGSAGKFGAKAWPSRKKERTKDSRYGFMCKMKKR
jgi:hypothetical protein